MILTVDGEYYAINNSCPHVPQSVGGGQVAASVPD